MIASSQEALQPETEGSRKWRFFSYALAIACIYSAAHIAARMLASPNLGEDDPLTNVLAQSLQDALVGAGRRREVEQPVARGPRAAIDLVEERDEPPESVVID